MKNIKVREKINKKLDKFDKYLIKQLGKLAKKEGIIPIDFTTYYYRNNGGNPIMRAYKKFDYLMWDDTENTALIIDENQEPNSLYDLLTSELVDLYFKIS